MSVFIVSAQEPFNVEIEPLAITNSPGLHSFVIGKTSDSKWVLFRGRTDGLHERQPFTSFLESDNNKNIFVIDPINNRVRSTDLNVLPASIYECLHNETVGIQDIDLNGTNMYNLSVYPNPLSNQVTVDYFVPNLNRHSLTILDITGNEIYQMELPNSIGKHSNKLDFSTYPAGTYIIKIVGGSYSTIKKVIKN